MQISIIAAMTKKQVIGQGNKLPWHLPAELKHFKAMTIGKPMIMGRATFDTIGRRLLPGRQTIVLTREPNFLIPSNSKPINPEGCCLESTLEPWQVSYGAINGALVDEKQHSGGLMIADTIEHALLAAGDVPEVMIVGGANIYQQFLPIADKMYLSIIQQDYAGDVFFPAYDSAIWQLVTEEINPDFTVKTLEKLT